MVAATLARLGESETSAPPELFVRGDVVAEKGGFVVTFIVKDVGGAEVGEREMRVQGRTCEAVTEPAALVLATMISVVRPRAETPVEPLRAPPDGGARTQVDTGETRAADALPSPSTARSIPIASTPRSDSQGAPVGRAAAPSRHTLGAAGVASVGVLPTGGFGAALRTSHLARSSFLLGLETSVEVGAWVRAGRGEVGFQLLSASVLAGFQVLRTAKVDLTPVVTFRGGVLRTSPSGFQLVKAEARPMALAGIGALVRVSLAPRLYGEALPQAELPLIRDVFQASEARTTYFLHQPSAVGARVSVGVGYEFP